MAERKRLWDWELRKALHILDANHWSDSTVLPGAKECWKGGEQEGWGYSVVPSFVLDAASVM